jgi:5'-phosphate synthase pdxT subunit
VARIGVLALQGAFARHADVVRTLGHQAILIRAEADFAGLEGLILPGGESSVQLDLLQRLQLEEPLRRVVTFGCPVLATCAGLILSARRVRAPEQRSFDFIDVEVERNGWGRQQESFEATSDHGRALVFIRAPRIVAVGAGVEIVDTFEGEPVLVRARNVTCATFHPELTAEVELHRALFGVM